MTQEPRSIAGKYILIVEDEALLALDLSQSVQRAGATVQGPCHTVEDAYILASASQVEGAILDVDIRGVPVFPVADLLEAKGVPIVFHTGRAQTTDLKGRYQASQICEKPTSTDTLLGILEKAITGETPAQTPDVPKLSEPSPEKNRSDGPT